MSFFRNLSIAKRLYLLNVVAAIGLIILSAITIYSTAHDLKDGKKADLRNLTEGAVSLIKGFHAQAVSGKMTDAQAQEAAKAAIASMRYDGQEYFWINDMTPSVIMHPIKPNLNGKNVADMKDPNGKALFVEFVNTVKTSGAGFVDYYWPKPGSENPVAKLSYVGGFQPWGWVVGTGVYMDVLEAKIYDEAMIQIAIQIVLQIVIFLISMTINRSIRKPVNGLIGVMSHLAEGNTDIDVPATNRGDEIGEMARAIEIFKHKTIENQKLAHDAAENEKIQADLRRKAKEQRLEADRKHAEEQAEQSRATAARAEHITNLSREFDEKVSGILDVFNSSASQMQRSAEVMSQTAAQTSQQTSAVASAAELATQNVQTVAAAAEQLKASINEISRQVSHSSNIAADAVSEAERTNAEVEGLAHAAEKIGEVINLINDIASQTNLLALNATIEAARAGEAGKGFAVVATEVKSLADQTAKATEDISSQVAGIQAATTSAVSAIRGIGETIDQVNGIASSISAAVEQQGASTGEIARNVQQAASGTQEVSSNIASVTRAVAETGTAAGEVVDSSRKLTEQADLLRTTVDEFLEKVRAA
jgi:methyl-accepting chemotaxis protein